MINGLMMSGLYNKYKIEKQNGEPIDSDAQYFVLRVDNNLSARLALMNYSTYIRSTNPDLADDIEAWIAALATFHTNKEVKDIIYR